jgi:hypothetical protein
MNHNWRRISVPYFELAASESKDQIGAGITFKARFRRSLLNKLRLRRPIDIFEWGGFSGVLSAEAGFALLWKRQ